MPQLITRINKEPVISLSQSSGTITLSYDGTIYTVPVGSPAANTRYQLYLVPSGGGTALVYSANENSQGPTGYPYWILVGSFFTKVDATFAAFLDINGNNEINIRYNTSTARAVNNSQISYVGWETLVEDSHNTVQLAAGSYSAATGLWSTNNWTFRPPLPGLYYVFVGIHWEGTPSSIASSRQSRVYTRVNGADEGAFAVQGMGGSTGAQSSAASGTLPMKLPAFAALEPAVFQSSGSNSTLGGSASSNRVQISGSPTVVIKDL